MKALFCWLDEDLMMQSTSQPNQPQRQIKYWIIFQLKFIKLTKRERV